MESKDGTRTTLEKLSSADQDLLWTALKHAIYVPEGGIPATDELVHHPGLAHYVEKWGRPGDLGFKALEEGKPLGAVWIRLFPAEDPCYGYAGPNVPSLSIAVWPGQRGKGIGTRLLQTLLTATEASVISLHVQKENPAVRLYERMGFQVWDEDGSGYSMRWDKP